MEYIYKNIQNKIDNALLRKINTAATRLYKKLTIIDLKELGISDYNQSYLNNKINVHIGTFQLYTYLLVLSIKGNQTPIEEQTLIDYGGGGDCFHYLLKNLELVM